MLLANYGSDSDSDSDSGPSRPTPVATPAPAAPKAAVKPKRKGPVKITLDLPKASGDDDEDASGKGKGKGKAGNGVVGGDSDAEDEKPVKKPKLTGAGSSSLLGMLPAPKRKLPQRPVDKGASLAVNRSMARPAVPARAPVAAPSAADDDDDDDGPSLMMPASLARAAAKKKDATAELDLFGLAEAAPARPSPASTTTPKPPSVSAAPAVADFVPPPPTASDPYPGYYQTPSGGWAAYEPEYYASFFAPSGNDELAEAEERKAGRVGRDWRALDDGRANVLDINVGADVAAARAEQDRRAKTVKPRLPGDDFVYKGPEGQTRGLAAERHQLTSLLSTAFSQREELEARIAENKKNMRASTQKYGF